MQILINVLDKIKKEISSTSGLYDRGWNDALEKAKERYSLRRMDLEEGSSRTGRGTKSLDSLYQYGFIIMK